MWTGTHYSTYCHILIVLVLDDSSRFIAQGNSREDNLAYVHWGVLDEGKRILIMNSSKPFFDFISTYINGLPCTWKAANKKKSPKESMYDGGVLHQNLKSRTVMTDGLHPANLLYFVMHIPLHRTLQRVLALTYQNRASQ